MGRVGHDEQQGRNVGASPKQWDKVQSRLFEWWEHGLSSVGGTPNVVVREHWRHQARLVMRDSQKGSLATGGKSSKDHLGWIVGRRRP